MACSSGRLGIFFFAYSAHTDLMGKSSSCPVQNRFKDLALNYLSETFQTASKVRDTGTAMDTAEDRRFAQLASLLDKFLQCVDLSVPDTRDTYLKSVIYNNKVQETSFDVYLPPALASKLSVKLS